MPPTTTRIWLDIAVGSTQRLVFQGMAVLSSLLPRGQNTSGRFQGVLLVYPRMSMASQRYV